MNQDPANLVKVRVKCDIMSSMSFLDGRKKGEEFTCPWLIAKQFEDMGKMEILTGLLPAGPEEALASSSQADQASPDNKPTTSNKPTQSGRRKR